MRFRPNSAELIEGSSKRLIFNLTPVVGANSIEGTPTLEASGLTFDDIAVDGTSISALVSGGTKDTDYIVKITALLSSGETEVGGIKLEWKEAGYEARSA